MYVAAVYRLDAAFSFLRFIRSHMNSLSQLACKRRIAVVADLFEGRCLSLPDYPDFMPRRNKSAKQSDRIPAQRSVDIPTF